MKIIILALIFFLQLQALNLELGLKVADEGIVAYSVVDSADYDANFNECSAGAYLALTTDIDYFWDDFGLGYYLLLSGSTLSQTQESRYSGQPQGKLSGYYAQLSPLIAYKFNRDGDYRYLFAVGLGLGYSSYDGNVYLHERTGGGSYNRDKIVEEKLEVNQFTPVYTFISRIEAYDFFLSFDVNAMPTSNGANEETSLNALTASAIIGYVYHFNLN